MRATLLTIFVLLFILQEGSSQYFRGTLGFIDGETLECDIRLKIKNSPDKLIDRFSYKMKYKLPGDDEVQTANFKDLDFIAITTDKASIFLRNMYVYYPRIRKSKPPVKSKTRHWLQYRAGCEEIGGYLALQEFEIDKKGQVWEKYLNGMGEYYVLKEGEDAPTRIGHVFLYDSPTQNMIDKQRKKGLERYFKGDEDGMKLLEGKTKVTPQELTDYLNSRCGNDE